MECTVRHRTYLRLSQLIVLHYVQAYIIFFRGDIQAYVVSIIITILRSNMLALVILSPFLLIYTLFFVVH